MKIDEVLEEYPYFYETHLHTNVSSLCGMASPEEMVETCKAHGYTGIIVTDHNWGGNTCIDRNLSWEDMISAYCRSYERAKVKGDEVGLSVFFGYEAGYNGTEFLIYGVDKDFLISNPEIKDASIEEQFEIIHRGGGIVVHAHPYREAHYIPEIRLFPEYIDAVEGINVTHRIKDETHTPHPEFDERAMDYSKKLGLPMTCGSDIHSTKIIGGGIRTKRKLNDIKDFTQLILSGEGYVLFDGDMGYSPR